MYYTTLTGTERVRLLETITNALCDSLDILLADKDGKVIFLTENMAKDMGAPPENILGTSTLDLVKDGVFTHSASAMALRANAPRCCITRNSTGQLSYGNAVPVRNEHGELEYVLTQGTSIKTLISMLEEMLNSNYNVEELNQLTTHLKEQNQQLIFRSDIMYRLIKYAEKMAAFPSNVLLTGESGVGKDVFANYIYRKSARSQKPFMPICIPAISPSLLEAELFGYVPGAFTNASKSGKQGLFEAANGGTVFLDEIGDIPMPLQVKLLRVLETQEIFRVGSTTPIKLDIRIISATNKNLLEMVERGEFRRDLYYRINTLSIEIPPLRKRASDIGVLADFFLAQINERHFSTKRFTEDAYEVLEQYSWPGNVRELRHTIEKMAVELEADTWDSKAVERILPHHPTSPSKPVHPFFGRAEPPHTSLRPVDNRNEIEQAVNLLEQEERRRIADAMIACNGNKNEMVKMLGYSRATLYRKLKKWGL